MTTLQERLCKTWNLPPDIGLEAADRINELEAQVAALEKQVKIAEKHIRSLTKWGDPILVDTCEAALERMKDAQKGTT